MFFRQLLNETTACASYLLGCKTAGSSAVVDPHEDLVDEYVAIAESQRAAITAVSETHVQADHVSGLPRLVERTGATAYVPEGAGGAFDRSLTQRLLALPDHVVLYPAHFPGSVCGRGLSANPVSTVGFERRHNPAIRHGCEDAFVAALLKEIPPPPAEQTTIVAVNRRGAPV